MALSNSFDNTYELVDFVSRDPSLEEVFLSEYGANATAPAAPASSGAAR